MLGPDPEINQSGLETLLVIQIGFYDGVRDRLSYFFIRRTQILRTLSQSDECKSAIHLHDKVFEVQISI
jgi:hypothetical protein